MKRKYYSDNVIFLKTIFQILLVLLGAFFFIRGRLYLAFFGQVELLEQVDGFFTAIFIADVVFFATVSSVTLDNSATININGVDKSWSFLLE